jgi:hypothetical protein
MINSEHPLNAHTSSSSRREIPRNPRAPLRSPVLCPIVAAHNTETPVVFIQVPPTSKSYMRSLNSGDTAHSFQYARLQTQDIWPAEQSSTSYDNGGSSRHLGLTCFRPRSPDVRSHIEDCSYHIPSSLMFAENPNSRRSPSAQSPLSLENENLPMSHHSLKHTFANNSPAARIPLVCHISNSQNPTQYYEACYRSPADLRSSPLQIPTSRAQVPLEPNSRVKYSSASDLQYNSLPNLPSGLLVDGHALQNRRSAENTKGSQRVEVAKEAFFMPRSSPEARQPMPSKIDADYIGKTKVNTRVAEYNTQTEGQKRFGKSQTAYRATSNMKPCVRTESNVAPVGEYGITEMQCRSPYISRNVDVVIELRNIKERRKSGEAQKDAQENSQGYAPQDDLSCAREDLHRRTQAEAPTLAGEGAQRRVRNEAQRYRTQDLETKAEKRRHVPSGTLSFASCERVHGQETAKWMKALSDQDLSIREAALERDMESRQNLESARKMATVKRASEVTALRQKISQEGIQGPRQMTVESKSRPRIPNYIPPGAVLIHSSEQRHRDDRVQSGEELRREIARRDEEVWGKEYARVAWRTEAARHKQMAERNNKAANLRTSEVALSRQTFPEFDIVYSPPDSIPLNASYLDRYTERRIAEAIKNGHPELGRALDNRARRFQHSGNMNFNRNNVNVTVNFQGKAARRAARMIQGRDGWRERVKDKALECCCSMM